ncbi:TetR/AcrR family transcriptional regulator [Natronobacterium gregoryi]|uniref:Transcriptional regulator n=2 Tax=Natronobacterium gregoryi TaxID=44930 RepID=L0ANW3_NATGS|nr:TetR/AcrR family transcriptional regulator [Natronobacterium gregoryi]AFZ74917.1 transcriptional regulator [Natronobacterium gregoryi SP2]ELY67395.1 transcription regulator [Natronobacterium gregoryi SP2]PLK19845.1 TetR/AcrR family transcriptional regulator [Natronobacterium gregoryi SP2]SFJ39084.1 transcriptional regulator, TetR family [Natronobacterium gregoryi]
MKGFSDDERERIRTALIESGCELFVRYGLERTRIKDITEEVGIGTSTFYQFFDSKEHLYLEVLYREVERFTDDLEAEIQTVSDPREQVRITLQQTFDEVETNPIIRNLIVENEIRTLETELSELNQQALSAEFDTVFVGAKQWVEMESFKYDDPAIVSEFIRTFVFVSRCKEFPSHEGTPAYPEIRNALIETVVDGLFED